jgi:hypothetical protein
VSFIPSARPTPIIGPISGEINIAPIITGIEFTFNPTLAITTANARIHTLGPLKSILEIIEFWAASILTCSVSLTILPYFCKESIFHFE